MGFSEVIAGHVDSLARGINVSNATPNGAGLADVNPVFTWVRLAQRVPVRIHIDHVPANVLLAAGMTATVQIDPRPVPAGGPSSPTGRPHRRGSRSGALSVGAPVHFVELDIFGVYIAPMVAMMVVAYAILLALRRAMLATGLLRLVWHPRAVPGRALPHHPLGHRAGLLRGRHSAAGAVITKGPLFRLLCRSAPLFF